MNVNLQVICNELNEGYKMTGDIVSAFDYAATELEDSLTDKYCAVKQAANNCRWQESFDEDGNKDLSIAGLDKLKAAINQLEAALDRLEFYRTISKQEE